MTDFVDRRPRLEATGFALDIHGMSFQRDN